MQLQIKIKKIIFLIVIASILVSCGKNNDEKLQTALLVEKNKNEVSDNKKYEWYAKWRRNNL